MTENLRDFPVAALAPHRVVAQSADAFLQDRFRRHPTAMIELLVAQGSTLRYPRSLATLLDTLAQHAPTFAARVRAFALPKQGLQDE